jgi:uncharacterized protein YjbI with pentapeptide repeats
METRAVRDLKIVLPGEEPDDLDPCEGIPRDGTSITEQLVSGELWARAHLTDVKMSRSWIVSADLGSSVLDAVTFERCVFKGCTLIGSRWDRVILKDVIFENCRFDYANLNDVKATGPVAFVGCSMTEMTVIGGQLSTVTLDNCRLTGLTIERCDLRGADLRGNDLSGLAAATPLRGVTLSESQLPSLTGLLTSELSIKVEPS